MKEKYIYIGILFNDSSSIYTYLGMFITTNTPVEIHVEYEQEVETVKMNELVQKETVTN
jgi:hypothetical protein